MIGPYYTDDAVTLYAGDCLEVLAELPDTSVDAVVTDPPYGLEFMGKEWDRFAPSGGNAAFTPDADSTSPIKSTFKQGVGTRIGAPRKNPRCKRCGRLGFDHAHRKCKCEIPDFDTRTREYAQTFGDWCQLWAAECLRVLKPGGWMLAFGGTRTWHRLAVAIEDAGFEIRDTIAWLYGSGFPKSLDVSKAIDRAAGAERAMGGSRRVAADRWTTEGRAALERGESSYLLNDTAPATADAQRWQGWGTALKPAHEPIVVARKPLSGTVAANVLAHGTGALNVDGCRIGTDTIVSRGGITPGSGNYVGGPNLQREPTASIGRWPANVALDETAAAALDHMSGESTSSTDPDRFARYKKFTNATYDGVKRAPDMTNGQANIYADTGGASRFYFTAKAGSDERITHDGVAHPTVKPLSLLRWLVRLVTPPFVTVCESCENRGRDSTTPASKSEDMRDMREAVPGQGQPEEATVLLKAMRGRGNASATPRPGVSDLRDDVQPGSHGTASPEVLLEDLRESVDGKEPVLDQGIRNQRQGIPDAVPAGSSNGDADGVSSGASASGRGDARSAADLQRGRSPSEWRQVGQPAGEPRGSAKERPRQDPQATAETDRVPPLRRDDQGLGTCATCGGGLSRRPGLILEPFAGSGTTVEAAILEGFHCIAIEREADYLPLITQRLNRRRDPVAYLTAAGEDLGLFGDSDMIGGGL